MITQPSQRPAIPVGQLKEVLAHVPDDDCLVCSRVYDFFIVDKEGHNKGYISSSGELHWWPVEKK
jgi:hypothetical protein